MDASSSYITLAAQPSAVLEIDKFSRVQCQRKRFTIQPCPQVKGLGYVDQSEYKEKGPHFFSLMPTECWKMNFAEFIFLYFKRSISPVFICALFPKPRVFTTSLFFTDSLCRLFSLWVCGDHSMETTFFGKCVAYSSPYLTILSGVWKALSTLQEHPRILRGPVFWKLWLFFICWDDFCC